MAQGKDWTDSTLERLGQVQPGLDSTVYEVTTRIARMGQHVARHQEAVFGRFGLNRGDVGVLSALRLAGASNRLSPTQLFKGLMLSSAGITSRLDRLEGRGLVRRLRDPGDRRGVLVELTDEGRQVVDQAILANTQSEPELIEGLSSAEVQELARLLKRMLDRLEPTEG